MKAARGFRGCALCGERLCRRAAPVCLRGLRSCGRARRLDAPLPTDAPDMSGTFNYRS